MASQIDLVSNQNYYEIMQELEKIYQLRLLIPIIKQKYAVRQRIIKQEIISPMVF